MDTQLALFEDEFNEEIAALTGAEVRNNTYLPLLKINRDPQDEAGNRLDLGVFMIKQGDMAVYGKPALFRPFINCFQYLEYDPKENNYVNKSIFIKKFSEEPLDMLGGLKCGKVHRDDVEKLSAVEQLRQKNIKCVRSVFGQVTMAAKSATGEHLDITNLPAIWRLSGANFSKPQDALNAITNNKHQYFNYNLQLSVAKPRKVGQNTFYDPTVEVLMDKVLRFTAEDLEVFKIFQDIISSENKFVVSKWQAAHKQDVTNEDEIVKDALAFPDDDLPF